MDWNPFLIYYNRLLSKFIETDHKNSIESIIIHGTPVRHNAQIPDAMGGYFERNSVKVASQTSPHRSSMDNNQL